MGGEDTLSNAFSLKDFPQVLISKTVDNDVGMIKESGPRIQSSDIINYFTLGYPTAARKISSFVSLNEGCVQQPIRMKELLLSNRWGCMPVG